MFFGWVFFLISLGGQAPHVRCTPMGRTCGEPNEIELTAIGVILDGPGRVRFRERLNELRHADADMLEEGPNHGKVR